MENFAIIQGMINQYPDVLNNRTKLKGILLDYFPNDKLTVNMFLMAYDEGFISKIESVHIVDEFMFQNFTRILATDYGVTDETANTVVHLVARVFNKAVSKSNKVETTIIAPTNQNNSRPYKKPISAQTPSAEKDFRYASNGKEVRINKYLGKGGKVVIPDYIEGLPVTRIAEYAFESKGAERITEITLPKQLEYIGSGAFQNLDNLSGVLILPPTLKEVDSHAFLQE